MRTHTRFTKRGVEALLGLVLVVTLLVATPVFAQQTAEQLIQSGLYQEEVKGNLDEAIKVYKRILKKFSDDRPVAATALLHIGLCHEKLGQTEARKHYQQLVNEYGDQPTIVAQARVRLSNLGYGTNGESLAMSIRQVWAKAPGFYGAVSPDGRYFSYVNWEKGNLAVHDIETGENRDLTDEGTWGTPTQFSDMSVWSPDSRQIVYLWYSVSDQGENLIEFRVVGLDGSEPRVLYSFETEEPNPWPTAWSQDGKYILTVLGKKDESLIRGREDRIALISVADGSARVLKSLGNRHTETMSLSPDGRYVAFELSSQKAPAQRNICILATDGSGDAVVVELEHPADDYAPYWAPDGKHIVFLSDRSGSIGLWMLEVDDGKAKGAPKLIKGLDGKVKPMGFTQDGSFHYSLGNSSRNIYVANLDIEAGKVLAPPTQMSLRFEGSNYSPAWSPDGKHLAYASQRSNSHENILVIQSVETGEERDVSPESLQMRRAHANCATQWSPDGRSILVAGSAKGDRGRNNLYLVDVQTGEFTPIKKNALSEEPLDAAKGWPVFSSDGKQIYYKRNHFKRNQSIVAHNLETHEEKELHRSNSIILGSTYPSPDGRRLIFVESETLASERPQVLKTVSISGGESSVLYEFGESWFGGLAWTPEGDMIAIEHSRNTPDKILIIPAEGGNAREIELGFKMGKFSLHPDGQRVAFTRGEDGGDTWVLENFLPESTSNK